MPTLVDKDIKNLVKKGNIESETGIEQRQIQPSSIDLRLGDKAYVVPCSFLPKDFKVGEFVRDYHYETLPMFEGQVLYPGNVYVIPLMESVSLLKNLLAHSNPKSSMGRIDVMVRMIADNVPHYDYLPEGYSGRLYAEVIPQSFPIKVREGDSLLQLRFFKDSMKGLDNKGLKSLCSKENLLYDESGSSLDCSEYVENDGLYLTVDISDGIVGYKAKTSTGMIDLSKEGQYSSEEFFEPVYAKNGELILEKGSFYILSTKENIKVPNKYSCEILPIEPSLSDLRSHYAGFIDPGWGTSNGESEGSPVVLEVRTPEHNFMVRDGQRLAKFVYVENLKIPETLYGQGKKNNYHFQKRNCLAKFFKN